MTKEQITLLRKNFCAKDGKGGRIANSIIYVHDNTIVFRDSNDFIVFDDANELMYCISANMHMPVKNECPYSVNATSYEMLQFVEANLTFEGLMALLKGMFSTLMKPDQIKLVENWAKNLPACTKGVEPNIGDYSLEKAPSVPRSTVDKSWIRTVEEESTNGTDEENK